MLRFLATGDIQAHSFTPFSYIRRDGLNSRLYNCLKIFRIIRKEAKERGIHKVLLNGDIFEENAYIEVDVYDRVFKEVEKLYSDGLEIIINLGNHDVVGEFDGRVLTTLRPFRRIAQVVEKPSSAWGGLVQVVPWMADPKKLKASIQALEASKKFALVLHCGVQGARTGPTSYLVRNPIKLRDVRPKDFGVVILSDYHTRQYLDKNVFYLGSPLQHSFGEIHRPCIWEIVLDGSELHAHKIYTNLPTFLAVQAHRLNDLKAREGSLVGNYVRVTLDEQARITDKDVEDYAKGKFLVDVVYKSHKKEVEREELKDLAPSEAISRYVASTAKERDWLRLLEIGQKLYTGDL